MHSFLKICIIITIGLILFNVGIVFINSLKTTAGDPIFPTPLTPGKEIATGENATDSIVATFTGGHPIAWILAAGATLAVGFGLAILTQSMIPVGLSIFGTIFWTAYGGAITVFYQFAIPPEFLVLFTVGMALLFGGAIVGVLTGSG